MAELDPAAQFYKTPHVIEIASDYIVTSWADGESMGKDFTKAIRASNNISLSCRFVRICGFTYKREAQRQ